MDADGTEPIAPPPGGGSGVIGTILGEYRVLGPLASGGMGTVYRAEHATARTPAALKVLRPDLSGDDDLVQRFFTEAKAASAIQHAGIVEIYDHGYTEDGLAYIVMELLAGETLGARLREVKHLPEMHAATLARAIAEALTAAHGAGIVHRDLKPDNVFLVPDAAAPFGERAKLLDFGIAKLTDAGGDSRTKTGALIGTPAYMAPEQAREAREIDARADLYSLGCMLYELLVGAPPFVAEGAGEIIAMQLFSPPEPPSVRLPSLAPGLEKIVMRLLDKEPDGRFPSAETTARALAAMIDSLSKRLATVVPGSGAKLPSGLFAPPPPEAVPPAPARPVRVAPVVEDASASTTAIVGKLKLAPRDEAPPPRAARSTTIPVIAGALAIAVATVAVAFAWTRDRGTQAAAVLPPPPPPITAPLDAAAPAPPSDAMAARPVVAAPIDAAVDAAAARPPIAAPIDAPRAAPPVDAAVQVSAPPPDASAAARPAAPQVDAGSPIEPSLVGGSADLP